MKRLMVAAMLSIGISSVVMSLGGNHGQQLDWQQLNLSAQQAQQVKTIRSSYRDDFQDLRKYNIGKSEKKHLMLVLRDKMIVNLQQVLSAEQREQAGAMMAEQAEKRINKRLDRLAGKLALTSKQQNAMRSLVNTNLVAYQKEFFGGSAIGINHQQSMFDQVDQIMPNILSSDQLQQWQKIKYKRIKSLT
jgi:hypothetical protein